MELGSQRILCPRGSLLEEHLGDLVLELLELAPSRISTDDLEVWGGSPVGTQRELDGLRRRRVTLLDLELEHTASATQVEIALPPGVEVPRSSQAQSSVLRTRSGLARVVDNDYRHLKLSLEVAQVGEEFGDLGGVVFVSVVESYQWIEDEDAGLELLEGPEEASAVTIEVEPQAGVRDDVEIEISEEDPAVPDRVGKVDAAVLVAVARVLPGRGGRAWVGRPAGATVSQGAAAMLGDGGLCPPLCGPGAGGSGGAGEGGGARRLRLELWQRDDAGNEELVSVIAEYDPEGVLHEPRLVLLGDDDIPGRRGRLLLRSANPAQLPTDRGGDRTVILTS